MIGHLRKLRSRGGYGERASRIARRWSNAELRRIAPSLSGDVVNVSAWEDRDKEGGFYRDYFSAATSYWLTNFGGTQGVLQHTPNELFLDLEQPLAADLVGRFDVVFNHTTLEHVWDFHTAFRNLCALSRDTVVLVVPWLQPMHTDYGDFWRFSPQAVTRLFDEAGLKVTYLSWTDTPNASVYVLAVASRAPGEAVSAPVDSSSPDFLKLPADFAGSKIFRKR